MAKIENSKVKNTGGGYARLFGNEELGELITKVHSAVISSGSELEKMINSILNDRNQLIENVDEFLSDTTIYNNSVFVIPKLSCLFVWRIPNFKYSEQRRT